MSISIPESVVRHRMKRLQPVGRPSPKSVAPRAFSHQCPTLTPNVQDEFAAAERTICRQVRPICHKLEISFDVDRAVQPVTSDRAITHPGFQARQIPQRRKAQIPPMHSHQTLALGGGLLGRDETQIASQLIHVIERMCDCAVSPSISRARLRSDSSCPCTFISVQVNDSVD